MGNARLMGTGHRFNVKYCSGNSTYSSDTLLCSYLRVNQVQQQVTACVTINACPFSTEKKHWKTLTIALFWALIFLFFLEILKMHFQEKKNASFMFYFSWNILISKKWPCVFTLHCQYLPLDMSIFCFCLCLTVPSSPVRTSTKTSRCRLTWHSTSSSCSTLASV